MASDIARQLAAQAWCKPGTRRKIMDPDLCEAFAEILDKLWSEPWLGYATNEQMLDELRLRIAVDGRLQASAVKGPTNDPYPRRQPSYPEGSSFRG